MGIYFSEDEPTPPSEPFINRFVDDVSDDEVREELGEPPYQFEERLDSKTLYGCRVNQKPPQSRHDWPFTWKTWFKRLFMKSDVVPFEQRGRYHDYPRCMPSRRIFPILVRKTWRRFVSFFKRGK